MKKALTFTGRILLTLLLVITILVAGVTIVNTLLGCEPYVIISESMAPVIRAGDIIFVKKVSAYSLVPGDIITFYQPNSNILVTHRVNTIDYQRGIVHTKGDGNALQDPNALEFSAIAGVYVYKIPLLGRVIMNFRGI